MGRKLQTPTDWRAPTRVAMGAGEASLWADTTHVWRDGLNVPEMRFSIDVTLDPGERIQVQQYDENGRVVIRRKRADGSIRTAVAVNIVGRLPVIADVSYEIEVDHDSSRAPAGGAVRTVTLIVREDLMTNDNTVDGVVVF